MLTTVLNGPEIESSTQPATRYLSFVLGNQHYAMALDYVKEVIGFPSFTPFPESSPHFMGVTNLRGSIMPLIDFRIKLKIEPTLTNDTGVIICDLKPGVLGLVVDVIEHVINPELNDILPSPSTSEWNTDFVTHVIKRDQNLSLVLDIKRLIGEKEQIELRKIGATKAA